MITSSIPENSSEADLSHLAQMVMSLFDHWNLSNEDQAFLLGLAPGNRAALGRYREGARISVRRERSTNVSGIFSAFTGAFVCCFRATGTWRTAG